MRPCRAWGTSRDRLVGIALREGQFVLFRSMAHRRLRHVETSTVVIMIGPDKSVQTQKEHSLPACNDEMRSV